MTREATRTSRTLPGGREAPLAGRAAVTRCVRHGWRRAQGRHVHPGDRVDDGLRSSTIARCHGHVHGQLAGYELSLIHFVAGAKNQVPRLVRRAEQDAPVVLTRRGRRVAVIISAAAFVRLTSGRGDLWSAIEQWRASTPLDSLDIDEVFGEVRDRAAGRDVHL